MIYYGFSALKDQIRLWLCEHIPDISIPEATLKR